MLLIFGIVFLLKKYLAEAAPLSTSGAYPPETFLAPRDDSTAAEGSHERTVWNILWSCLATTFACTWVSVHPNVPYKDEGKWEILGRRVFLMFFSILMPEVMVMWAFKQWRGAVMIKNVVNGAKPSKLWTMAARPWTIAAKPWTTTHGHFLQMGGFRISMTREECDEYGTNHFRDAGFSDSEILKMIEARRGKWMYASYIIRDDGRFVEGLLMLEHFRRLLHEGLISFPTITEDEIKDRSKGDALSKGIASLQLVWFIAQIITRAVQGLAVTELELTTAALAGLNSAMYLFWWSKPLDVRCPVVIRTKGAQRVEECESWAFEESEEFSLRKHMWESVKGSLWDMMNSVAEFVRSLPGAVSGFWREIRGVPNKMAWMVKKLKQAFTRRSQNPFERSDGDDVIDRGDHVSSNISGDATVLRSGWILKIKSILWHALVWLPAFVMDVIEFVIVIPIGAVLGGSASTLRKWEDMTSMMFYSEYANARPLLGSSAIAGALFGAVHCFAWRFSFPSHVEQIMWRSASLTVACSCVLVFLGCLFHDAVDQLDDLVRDVFVGFPFFGCLLLYPIARICLLVLAVVSLRSLPQSAFDTVRWIELVPHI